MKKQDAMLPDVHRYWCCGANLTLAATALCLSLVSFPSFGQQLLMAMENLSAKAAKYQKQQNIQQVPILYAADFDPEDDGRFDERMLLASIEKKIPNKQFDGIAVLDWEAPGFNIFEKEDSSVQKFQETMQQYLQLLQACKAARPLAKWGYYGIPFCSYWDSSHVVKQNGRMDALLKRVDVLLPSLYSYYPEGTRYTNNAAYFTANARAFAAIADAYQKKCYVFVWHRFHQSNQEAGLSLIPTKEFETNVQDILKGFAAVGQAPEGIIWWGADDYFLRTGHAPLVKEVGNKSFIPYQNDLIIQYAGSLKKLLK